MWKFSYFGELEVVVKMPPPTTPGCLHLCVVGIKGLDMLI